MHNKLAFSNLLWKIRAFLLKANHCEWSVTTELRLHSNYLYGDGAKEQ